MQEKIRIGGIDKRPQNIKRGDLLRTTPFGAEYPIDIFSSASGAPKDDYNSRKEMSTLF
jgi:hypothetical protein